MDDIREKRAPLFIVIALLLALLPLGPARAATEPPYHVHLSWQHDPHTTVTVTWHNDTGLTGYAPVVRYGTSPGVYTKTTAGTSHTYSGATVDVSDVELTGLTPDTRYYYRCGDATYGWSAEASFVTPPVVKKGFKFCAYGDSRDDWWPLYENNDFSIWGDIASRVQAEDPLFSIFTADFVSDGTSESSWNQWFTKFEPLSKNSAFMSCHGNHEKYANAFFHRFAFPENERWYSFDVSNVHFTCLDTGLSDNEPALIDQQKAWLSSDLAAADARGVDWKVVYFHRSPYATSSNHGNQADVIAGWVPIFDQYKVDVVFNGHNHYYERSYPMRGGVPITGSLDYYWQPDGVVYVTAGCAGAPLVNTGSAPWVAKNAKEYNYCVVDVLPNRSMRVQAKKRDGSLLEQFTIAKDNAPILYSVSPSTARAGEEVTVSGKRFGLERGSSAVWFGSTRATEYASWSDEQVKVRVPGGVSGQVQLKVQTQDGSSKTVPFTVLLTPSDQAPTITSISPSSGSVGTTVTIKGTSFGSSRGTSYVKFNTTKAATTDYVSWSASQIKVKVPQGATTGPVSVTTGVGTSKSKTFTVITPVWYLAEGTSDYGFETYITIENPNATAVTAMVTYMTKAGPRTRAALALPAMSQTVINPRNDIDATDFSTKVKCKEDKDICVDRRMIWTGPGAVSPEGHSSVGVTAPAKTWYLTEGSSSWGFETWLLIQNPNDKDASVTITYMIEGETPVEKTKTVTASSRASFNMETDIGQKDTSIKVESNIPVIPERAMYRNNKREGHDSIGTTTPAKDYYLAEGTTAWGFTTYVLVQNPNPTPTDVTVTYMTPAGEKPQAPFSMPANSRKTIRVNDIAEVSNTDLSTRVQGTSPIIAERAMYWDNGTGEACHDSIGMDSPHMTFYLPDGETYNGMETWTLIQNPNASAVTVEISYLTPTGTGNVVFTETIGANSRESYSMADKLPNARASVMVKSKDAGKPIMVERAMYWNNKGAGADTIGGYGD